MKFREGLFGFSSSDYSEKISSRDYTYADVATNIYRKRRAIASSKTTAVGGVAAVHVTGGASLVGTAWSARNISVEKKKLRLLEEEWARRGQEPLPKRTLKDTLIPIIITGAIGVFTFSIDLAISNATATAAQAAAMGIPGYEFHGHLVGAYYTTIEKGAGKLGSAVNSLSYKGGEEDEYYDDDGDDEDEDEDDNDGNDDDEDDDDDDDDDDDGVYSSSSSFSGRRG